MFLMGFLLKFNCRLEDSTFIMEDSGLPVMLPTAEDFELADKEVDGTEKEEDQGIFQVLERLEEVNSLLTSR
jgi:hypothetical protein